MARVHGYKILHKLQAVGVIYTRFHETDKTVEENSYFFLDLTSGCEALQSNFQGLGEIFFLEAESNGKFKVI